MRCRVVVSLLMALPAVAAEALPHRTIEGRVTLNAPLRENVDDLIFAPNAVLVTQGHDVSITARDIKIRGNARIIAFDTPAPPGRAGRSAGQIVLRTEDVEGGVLTIVNGGQNGGDGLPGRDGAPGPPGPQGQQRDFSLFSGCSSGSSGMPGGAGQAGGNGGDGGAGGDGGKVTLFFRDPADERRIRATAPGGLGGAAGRGGIGGPGGPGGVGAPGTTFCGGTSPGPPGPQGSDGKPGTRGVDGSRALIDIRIGGWR